MRVVFMGTPQFAVPTLQALLDSRHQVVFAVSQPDKPKGRGQHLAPTPVKALAESAGVPVDQPAAIRSKDGVKQKAFAERVRSFQPDIAVVVAYGKILPQEVLDAPRLGCLNVHASLLPKYRGAAPIQWAIANGETVTGSTIMQMDAGMDTGDVLAAEELEILPDDDAVSVANALSVIGARKLVEVLDAIEAGNAPAPRKQSEMGEPSLAPILKKEDGVIDWTMRTDAIICRVQGFKPWPGAYGLLNDQPFQILRAEPLDHLMSEEARDPKATAKAPSLPGQVVGVVKERGFVVRTGSGELLAAEVKPPNKGAMSGLAAINGRLIRIGDVLG